MRLQSLSLRNGVERASESSQSMCPPMNRRDRRRQERLGGLAPTRPAASGMGARGGPAALQVQGLIALKAGQAREAADWLGRAAAMAPGDAGLLVNLGIARDAAGDRAGAEAALRDACRADPMFAPAAYNLGMLLFRSGDEEGADAALTQALSLAPDYAKAYCALARLKAEGGNQTAALQTAEAGLAYAPKDADLLLEAAQAGQALGDYAQAARRYQACLENAPNRPTAWVNLGFCLQEEGRVEEAFAAYRQALAADRTLYASVLKNLTNASHGRLPLNSRALASLLTP